MHPFALEDMLTSVSIGSNVTQTFTNQPDWFSTKYASKDGYSLCGKRYVYMQWKDHPTSDVGSKSLVTPWIRLLLNETDNESNPYMDPSTVFELVVYSDTMRYRGEYEFLVHIELADYPTATPAVAEFLVSVDPCIVQSLVPPADLNVTYVVHPEAELMTIEYNFA